MSNDYFDDDDWAELQRLNLVRSAELNAIVQAVVTGFNVLPSAARLKQGRVTYLGIGAGTANAHTVTYVYAPDPLALTDGDEIIYKAPITNTAALTVDPGGIGAISVRNYAGAVLTGGETVTGAFIHLRYDGTNGYFRIINPVTAVASVTTFDISALTTLAAAVSPSGDYVAIHSATEGLRKTLVQNIADEQSLVLASQVYGRR